MPIPRHSARRAGIRQRRVAQPVFDAIKALEGRARQLRRLGDDLAGAVEDIDPGAGNARLDAVREAVKAWYAATRDVEGA